MKVVYFIKVFTLFNVFVNAQAQTSNARTGINIIDPKVLLHLNDTGNNDRRGLTFPILNNMSNFSDDLRDGMVSFFAIPSNYGFYVNNKKNWYKIYNEVELTGNLDMAIFDSGESDLNKFIANSDVLLPTGTNDFNGSSDNWKTYSCWLRERTKFDHNFRMQHLPESNGKTDAIYVGKKGLYSIVVNATIEKKPGNQSAISQYELYLCMKRDGAYLELGNVLTNVPNVATNKPTYVGNTINTIVDLNVGDLLYVILKFIDTTDMTYHLPLSSITVGDQPRLPISISLTYLDEF